MKIDWIGRPLRLDSVDLYSGLHFLLAVLP
jgi:hypothetical protein